MKRSLYKALKPSLALSFIVGLPQVHAQQTVPDVKVAQHHLSQTPVLNDTQNEKIADKIGEIILSRILTRDIDADSAGIVVELGNQTGILELKKKILHLISQSQPLVFTLVGFPFKSGNTEKNVIGYLPDQAENLALKNMQKFMEDIRQIYKPGAKLQIYTDGLAFFDLLGIPLDHVLQYEKALKQLASDLPSVSIVTCQDLFSDKSPQEMHDFIKSQAIPLKELTTTGKDILRGRLLKVLDDSKGRDILKKHSLDELAEEMHQRSQKINHLYKGKFPESIYFSAHYQKDLSKKVGISLLPGSLTPWHGVAVLNKDGSFMMKQKKDVEKSHHLSSTVVHGIKCYYYTSQ